MVLKLCWEAIHGIGLNWCTVHHRFQKTVLNASCLIVDSTI